MNAQTEARDAGIASEAAQSFNRLVRFIRALNHRLRTPLSVISNDLYYLRTVAAGSEIERSMTRVQEMKSILNSVSLCGTRPLEFEEASFEELARGAADSSGTVVRMSSSALVRVDRERIVLALTLVLEMLRPLSFGSLDIAGAEDSAPTVNIYGNAALPCAEGGGSELDLERFLLDRFGPDDMRPVIIAAIFSAHGVCARVELLGQPIVRIQFPAVMTSREPRP